jgi:FkbM family methyltransferase
VVLFEPNPPAIEILKINMALNGLLGIADFSHLGVGLSDAAGRAHPIVPDRNLGGTRLQPTDESSGLPLIRGDDVLSRRHIDFIKIDVEGMEMQVLSGLFETILKLRPFVFIEVSNTNKNKILDWVKANDFKIARTYHRYDSSENYMLAPVERLGLN